MIDSPHHRDPVELLADEFASRVRRGESPSVAEYTERYPQFAEAIEDIFPAVAMMEQIRSADAAERRATFQRSGPAKVPEAIGDFTIIKEIGRGGMGIVYEAQQQSLARRVAVKVLPKHVLLLDEHLGRFQREAQTTAKLQHTNIVPVFGVGQQDGLHYYVMPLVRGVGLDEVIRELKSTGDASPPDVKQVAAQLIEEKFAAPESPGGKNAPSESNASYWRTVAQVGRQAADALDYSHRQGTLHRDIKPGNLLVDKNLLVCVADFGLARAVDPAETSRGDEIVGTLKYMAPEQFRGTADARSDVYSLGRTLYELLTLQSPPADARRGCLPQNGQSGSEPMRPGRLNQAVPRDLKTIVLKCLAREPARRYQTAAALAEDLRCFLEDRPIRARRTSFIERSWRWCRRNPALAVTSALIALLLVAVGTTATVGHLQTKKAYEEATEALARVEATSQVSLEALDDIYLQLSPDRIWILSSTDGSGEACACLGLRSSAGSVSSAERAAMQLQASEETAALLKGLLVFYDRLAEQAGDDFQVVLQSAIAGRRVGDIRQRLGQFDEAESQYFKAIDKLTALSKRKGDNAELALELARSYNELGNVRAARLESGSANESYRDALYTLESFPKTPKTSAEHRYETARTLYLLANTHTVALGNRRGDEPSEDARTPIPRRLSSRQCRRQAIEILEELVLENANIPDYRFLLALCHRPSAVEPTASADSTNAKGRGRAIRILEELRTAYPEVVDYRYELTATYAWIQVGLFPWQEPAALVSDAEASLQKALVEIEWLVAHNPSIPHYASSKALILAKLGTVSRQALRLEEAEDYFRRAHQTQAAVVENYTDLPPHHRLLTEFMSLRLVQVRLEQSPGDLSVLNRSADLLESCIETLTRLAESPELSDDRLVWSSLPEAYETLSNVYSRLGQDEQAKAAGRLADETGERIPEGPRNIWQL